MPDNKRQSVVKRFINRYSTINKDEDILKKYLSSSIAKTETEETLVRVKGGVGRSGQILQGLQKNFLTIPLKDLIARYRDISIIPEVSRCIEIVMNNTIDFTAKTPVSISIDNKVLDKKVIDKIKISFDNILKMLDFKNKCEDYFRDFFIDGRLCFENIFDIKTKKLIGVKQINSKNVTPFVEIGYDDNRNMTENIKYNYFFMDNNYGEYIDTDYTPETFTFISSEIYATEKNLLYPFGFLHKALKPVNRLVLLQDAILIYRITRATEKRVFKLKTGRLNEAEQEQVLAEMMRNFNNKKVLDASGEINSEYGINNMLEDIWVSETDNSSVDVEILQGGQNLDDLEDVKYFQKKVYEAMDVPRRYIDPEDSSYNYVNIEQIEREEYLLEKFVERFRKKFCKLFIDLIRKDLYSNGDVSKDYFDEKIKEHINFDFITDNKYKKINEMTFFKERLSVLDAAAPHLGIFFSKEYVMKNILKFTDDEIIKIREEIQVEAAIDKANQTNDEDYDKFE